MHEILRVLVEKCEIAVHKDAKGWHFSAKGGLGVAIVLALVLFLARVL